MKLPYIAPSLGGVESLIEQPTVIRWVGLAESMQVMLCAAAMLRLVLGSGGAGRGRGQLGCAAG